VVIAVSHFIRDYITQHYRDVPTDRVHVVHRGIDPQAFPHGLCPGSDWLAGWHARFPELAGRKLVTLAGRITRLKGHMDFLELIAALKSDGIDVHGLIVGDEDPRRPQYAASVRSRIDELGLSGRVTMTGHRSDIREIYAISSVVLSLSMQPESFGRTTLEPLALGVPVVGYDHGGVGEILRTVFPSGAVPFRNAAALKQRTAELLNGSRAVVAPFEQFRLRTMLDQEIGLYERLAAERVSCQNRRAA
ncbi:MAG: glycosyltransferase, partial [Planctomycetaceae bacterium]|nr:glycosyltransferase [Planctomycetaceae bacterium]